MTWLQNTSNVQKVVHASTKVIKVWNYVGNVQVIARLFCLVTQLFSRGWHLGIKVLSLSSLDKNSLTVFYTNLVVIWPKAGWGQAEAFVPTWRF